jgi:hypothetical protein
LEQEKDFLKIICNLNLGLKKIGMRNVPNSCLCAPTPLPAWCKNLWKTRKIVKCKSNVNKFPWSHKKRDRKNPNKIIERHYLKMYTFKVNFSLFDDKYTKQQ